MHWFNFNKLLKLFSKFINLDFHKLIVTLFKSEISQQGPNIISYRNYKRFDIQTFERVISKKIEENTSMDFEALKRTIVDTLDKQAPLKKKYLRANHSNFVAKELSKAIINRSRLRNQFLKSRSVECRMEYNKQRNICVALPRKTKRKYYEDLRLSDVNDNQKFWKTVNPLFGNKIKSESQIALAEGNNLVTDDKVLAKTFNKFFVNVAATLGIKYEKFSSNYHSTNCNLDQLIIRYNDHPSILAIKNKCTELNSTFTFTKVDKEQISIAIKRLDTKKVSKSKNIPLRIIKEFSDIFGGFLAKNFSECLGKGFFLDELKCAEGVPVYKKRVQRIRITKDLSVFCLIHQNYMKGLCINESMDIFNHFYQSFNAVSEKDSVHNTVF